jgi:hypothetical protein
MVALAGEALATSRRQRGCGQRALLELGALRRGGLSAPAPCC